MILSGVSALSLSRLFIMPKTKGPAFYAVRRGRQTGIFSTWDQCEKQVKGFLNPRFKKFSTRKEAEDFVDGKDEVSQQGSVLGDSPSANRPVGPTAPLGKPFTSWKDMDNKRKVSPDPADDWTTSAANISTGTPLLSLKKSVANMRKMTSQIRNYVTEAEEWTTSPANASSDVTHLLTLKKSVANIRKATSQIRTYITEAEDHIAELQSSKAGDTSAPTPTKRARTECSSSDQVMTVYTDGACTDNGKVGARAGIGVYWGPDSEHNVSERLPGRQTNNRAEIHAAVRAIQQAKAMGLSEVIVKTDSKFLIESITKWMDGWKRRNWQLSSGGPVKNKEDFVALDEEMRGISVKWQHVRGHSGEPGNEAADSLAVRGAQMPASH